MPQVRAIASDALSQLHTNAGLTEALPEDRAAHTLISADIKRFLERPAEPIKSPVTADAPPGAPIGDFPLDWLAPAPWVIR